MHKLIKTVLFMMTFSFAAFTSSVFADEPIYTGVFSNKALKGYDAVSYFQGSGQPAKGVKEYKTEWRGADWYFASAENLELFKANPEQYAPQYGGYCAWAVAQGKLAKGDPLVYTLIEDKLYLNYDTNINNKWLPKKEAFIEQADSKFSDLVDLK